MAQVTAVNALQFIVDKAMDALSNVDVNKTKVVWFGYTVYIDIIQKALISRGKRIHYVIDNDVGKYGMILEDDLIVFPVNQIASNYKEKAVFLISSRFEPEMRQQLLALGVNQSQIITLPSREESDVMAQDFLLKKTEGLKKIELRELQLIMLDLMKTLRDFCNANGLRYFLAGGTLLGAARHKGFIPWDDDADVYLPYEDYRRFVDTFPVGGRYEVVNWEKNPEFVLDWAKLVDNTTIMQHGGYPVRWSHGVSICVFPIYGYPDDENEIIQKRRRDTLLDMKWYWYCNAKDVIKTKLQDIRQDIVNLKNDMSFYSSPCTANGCNMHIATSVNNIDTCDTIFKPRWYAPVKWFEPILLEFEGEQFTAPKCYDQHLKMRYGNYMVLPPENERINHKTDNYYKNKHI
jgi:phosphorylcholine metabolism protein LicD